jgi:hypothetical protein
MYFCLQEIRLAQHILFFSLKVFRVKISGTVFKPDTIGDDVVYIQNLHPSIYLHCSYVLISFNGYFSVYFEADRL